MTAPASAAHAARPASPGGSRREGVDGSLSVASSPVTASGATTAAGRRASHVGNPLALRLINAATATVERMPVAAPARIAALKCGVAVDFLGIVSPISIALG